jgi:glycerophosphoryl diester phosphodiesterase
MNRQDAASRWRRRERPLVIAHRGASARATENTVEAVELARAEGADAVEIDVQLAAGGEPVVFHDDTLERLTGRLAAVAATPLLELRRLRLVGGGRIATLLEILEAAGPDLLVDLEVKSADPRRSGPLARAIAAALARHPSRQNILISSFDPAALIRLGRLLPGVPLGYLFHRNQRLPLRRGWPARLIGAAAVHPEHTLVTAARVERWHRRGLLVNPWTVDHPARLRALARLGVDGICTNDPAGALAALTV